MAGSAGGFRLTVRKGGKVEKTKTPSLEAALIELEFRGAECQRDARGTPVDTKVLGRYEPAQQVVARIELAGPRGLRAGVDVRGDTSAQAYTGRFGRRIVERREGESAYDALRRVLGAG